jgi:hypothetical protein
LDTADECEVAAASGATPAGTGDDTQLGTGQLVQLGELAEAEISRHDSAAM